MAITAEQFARWKRGDILDFCDTCCIMRRPDGTVGPLSLSEVQAEWLLAVAAQDDRGLPRYSTVGVVGPKRCGKTVISAAASLWKAVTGEDRLNIHLSNSRESAQDLSYRQVREFIEKGPLRAEADVQRNSIFFRSLGSEIRALPCSAGAAAGVTVSGLLCSDELWLSEDPEPFDLLMKQRGGEGQALVVSQASGVESRVYELYRLAQDEDPPHLRHFYVEPDWLREHGSPNPYVTEETLAQWRLETPVEAQWRHWFLNEWSEGAGEFLAPEHIDAAVIDAALPTSREELAALLKPWKIEDCAFDSGLDRSMPGSATGDSSYYVTTARTPDDRVVVIGVADLVTGSKQEVFDAHTRMANIIGYWPELAVEVYQSADLAAELDATVITPSSQTQQRGFSALARLFAERRITIPEGGAEVLIAQVRSFGCDTSTSPPRYGKKVNRRPDDSVYALCWSVYEQPRPEPAVDLEAAERQARLEYNMYMKHHGLGAARL